MYFIHWIIFGCFIIPSITEGFSEPFVTNEDAHIHRQLPDDESESVDQQNDIDPLKYERASYKHEQALLAAIYAPGRTYISKYEKTIHPTDFTRLKFENHGTYRLILLSLQGDADLYISTKNELVSYDNYELSSCTCGIDEVVIQSYMKRPIHIAIYGSSQYRNIRYRLLIEKIEPEFQTSYLFFNEGEDKQTVNDELQQKPGKTLTYGSNTVHEKSEESNTGYSLWSLFVAFLELVIEIVF